MQKKLFTLAIAILCGSAVFAQSANQNQEPQRRARTEQLDKEHKAQLEKQKEQQQVKKHTPRPEVTQIRDDGQPVQANPPVATPKVTPVRPSETPAAERSQRK